MEYGKSDHYLGRQGESYFAVQHRGGAARSQVDLWKFTPWIQREDSVLDFGCGGGWLLSGLEVARKCGVELNPAARRACGEKGIAAYPEISALPPGIRFSKIVSHHCLEHVPYPSEALRALGARLEPGGLLILVVPLDDWRMQRDFSGTDYDHHLHTWTPRLLANTLAEAGFECVQVDILTHAWPYKWEVLYGTLPLWAFNLACRFWGWARKRRQLRAVARGKIPQV